MTTAACAAAGSGSDYSADTTNGYCICSDSTKYLASDA